MSLVRERKCLTAGLAALAFAVGAPMLAQQQTPGAAQPQNAQPPPGVQQQRRGGGGGGGGRPQTQPLGDGPWDFTTEQGRIHVTVVTKGLERPWGMAFLPNGDVLVTERPGRL